MCLGLVPNMFFEKIHFLTRTLNLMALHGVLVTGEKLSKVFVVSGDILSPVSLLPAIYYRRRQGIDKNPVTGFITGVNDTGNNLSPITTTHTGSILLPVSLTPVSILCENLVSDSL